MAKNILFTGAGLFLGFALGFLIANSYTKATAPVGSAASVNPRSGAAPPLDPTQTDGKLPPGHPNIGGENPAGANAATGSPNIAATSAQAQSAMEDADRQPKDFDAQMNAAAVFYRAGAFDKAALYLTRALAVKPTDADALTAMGDTKYETKDYATAATFYERSLARNPNDADVRTDLGNAYFQRTPPDYDRAIKEYRLALSIDPKHEKTLQNLAAAFLRKGDKTNARDAIENLARVNPSNPAIAPMRAALQNSTAP
ncbi:MAG: tetratricopeptide repeat protein [Pyrinomonadaceae bacterium]